MINGLEEIAQCFILGENQAGHILQSSSYITPIVDINKAELILIKYEHDLAGMSVRSLMVLLDLVYLAG